MAKFTIEAEYQQYLKQINLPESKMHENQRVMMRQTFFAAAGQTLMLLRDDVSSLGMDEAVQESVDLLNECVNEVSKISGRLN